MGRESFRVVSRALAVIQAITAILDISYLPERLVALSRHIHEVDLLPLGSRLISYDASLVSEDRIYLAFLTFRIGLLCLATLLFWRCGPLVEKLLDFSTGGSQSSDQTGSA